MVEERTREEMIDSLVSALETSVARVQRQLDSLRKWVRYERLVDPLEAPEIVGADEHGDGGDVYVPPRIELDE